MSLQKVTFYLELPVKLLFKSKLKQGKIHTQTNNKN